MYDTDRYGNTIIGSATEEDVPNLLYVLRTHLKTMSANTSLADIKDTDIDTYNEFVLILHTLNHINTRE
jgi:hypothetical protein